jgi:hypothetical protein
MFDTSIKTDVNNTQTKLFSDKIGKTLPASNQISASNFDLPLKQQSTQSLHKISKHYKEFQHALHMLKISVEELWRLELQQLRNNESISPISSNIKFDLQVPSIYTCRAVLPIASEIIYPKAKISSSINSSIMLQPSPTPSTHEIKSIKMGIKEKIFQSNIQSVDHKKKSTGSLHSISKKRRHYESGDNFTKYRKKTALLHLKFQCLKHMH